MFAEISTKLGPQHDKNFHSRTSLHVTISKEPVQKNKIKNRKFYHRSASNSIFFSPKKIMRIFLL